MVSRFPRQLIGAPLFHLFRFQMLLVAALFLVTVAPYIGRFTPTGFWHFNKTLFFRVLMAALFSQVLYAGLAIALAALQNLFGLEVPGRRYFQLWILVTGSLRNLVLSGGSSRRCRESGVLNRTIRGASRFLLSIFYCLWFSSIS